MARAVETNPLHLHASGSRCEQPGGESEQSCLARAARSEEKDQLSGVDGKRNIAKHLDGTPSRAATLPDTFESDGVHERKASSGSMSFKRRTGMIDADNPEAESSVATSRRSSAEYVSGMTGAKVSISHEIGRASCRER